MKYSETFTSATATHVNFDIYLPNVMIRYKAIIQIHHAMSEYSGRYQRFAEYLAHDGFVVVVSDFPGHGTSLYNYEQGYFGIGDATKTLVEDMHRLRNIIANRYPDLPYFMLGNQLGSLVLRQYIASYGDFIQGCILMGTSGKAKHYKLGKALLRGDILIKGRMHRSKTVRKTIINKFIALVDDKSYLTGDLRELELYQDDPFTDFTYTNKAYNEILRMIKEVASKDSLKRIPYYMSILIVSGRKDPFGILGRGPSWLYEKLKNNGVKDLSLKIYNDSHQDILHDCQRLEVYQDILTWLNERTFI